MTQRLNIRRNVFGFHRSVTFQCSPRHALEISGVDESGEDQNDKLSMEPALFYLTG